MTIARKLPEESEETTEVKSLRSPIIPSGTNIFCHTNRNDTADLPNKEAKTTIPNDPGTDVSKAGSVGLLIKAYYIPIKDAIVEIEIHESLVVEVVKPTVKIPKEK